MLTVVDKHDGMVIQKVTTPKGKLLGYQTLPQGCGDTKLVKRFKTLEEARDDVKHWINHPINHTVAKHDLPHNQKGYDPHRTR